VNSFFRKGVQDAAWMGNPSQELRAPSSAVRRLLKHSLGILTLALAGGLAPRAAAVEPAGLTGALVGIVTDQTGRPQMGAAVLLYNRSERLLARIITNEKGLFLFDSLSPESYSLRVSMASFLPAFKREISVRAGSRSFLNVNLSSVLSSIELIYLAPGQAPIMSEEWKWVLRSSAATRPVLRMLPGIDISDPSQRTRSSTVASMFSDTRGVVKVSAGDGAATAAGNQPDLGTAFALATSVFGANQVQVSGNVGYASHSGIPTAGFRTSYRRDAGGDEESPQVNLTMRQVFLPARAAAGFLSGAQVDAPVLRTMTISSVDRRKLTEDVELEYGASLESVSYLNRLNYVSPYARLRWGSLEYGALEIAFSSGAPPAELLGDPDARDAEMQRQLATLAMFPRVSLRQGHARVQRTQNFEIGYRRDFGTRTVSAGLYKEAVTNAAFAMAGSTGIYSASDLLPDLGSNSSIFNAGDYRRSGYHVALSQRLSDTLAATVSYGYGGALEAGTHTLATRNPNEVRSLLRTAWRHSVTMRVNGTAPGTGTRYGLSYQLTDYDAFQPMHLSLTQRTTLDPGLNIHIRQPIPGVAGVLSGRLEATAELRNLLAQGYLPLTTSDGQHVVLIQAPRAVRGGLSFIF
jgi:hypothetical protein